MKAVLVAIKGITPLLMHRFPMEPVEGFEKKTREEQAEIAAYRLEDGELYVPGVALQRCLVNGAVYVKGKGRASLQKTVAAGVFVVGQNLGLGQKVKYTIDSRRVVVPATRGAIVRHRPLIEQWALEFPLHYDEVLLSEKQLRDVVDHSGSRVGLLDYRPEKKGPFGRFMVTAWEVD